MSEGFHSSSHVRRSGKFEPAGLLVRRAIASCFSAFLCFRSSARSRFRLRFGLIEVNSRTDKIFESALINLVTLEKINRTSRVAFEARVEKLIRIRESGPVSKG